MIPKQRGSRMNRRYCLWVWLVVTSVAALVLGAVPAWSLGAPPRVFFGTTSKTVRPLLYKYCWSSYQGPFEATSCAGGTAPVRRRAIGDRRTAYLRIEHPQEPELVKVTYWKGSATHRPPGAIRAKVTTRPDLLAPHAGWILDLDLPRRWATLTLDVKASWDHEVSCPTCRRQWARWRLTLASR